MQYLESKLNQHQVFTRVLYPSRVLALLERGKPGGPGEKPSEKDESQQQTRPTHDRAGIEPGSHCWQVNAVTTAPSLLPSRVIGVMP